MRLALEAEGFDIRCEPLDARSAIAAAGRERPEVCLIDEGLAGGALVAVDAIFHAVPETKNPVLTDSEEPRGLLASIRAGASGYLRKNLDPIRLPVEVPRTRRSYFVSAHGNAGRAVARPALCPPTGGP